MSEPRSPSTPTTSTRAPPRPAYLRRRCQPLRQHRHARTSTIAQALTTTVGHRPVGGPFTYDGAPSDALPPSRPAAPVGLSRSTARSLAYTDNVNAGTATGRLRCAGDANHFGSTDSRDFTIAKAPSTTVVTIVGPVVVFTYERRGSDALPRSRPPAPAGLSPEPGSLAYADNVNAGTATGDRHLRRRCQPLRQHRQPSFTIAKASTSRSAVSDLVGGPFEPPTRGRRATGGRPARSAAGPAAAYTDNVVARHRQPATLCRRCQPLRQHRQPATSHRPGVVHDGRDLPGQPVHPRRRARALRSR